MAGEKNGAKVVGIGEARRNEELVEYLERLAESARRGDLLSIACCVQESDGWSRGAFLRPDTNRVMAVGILFGLAHDIAGMR